jgi:hypothetical protein
VPTFGVIGLAAAHRVDRLDRDAGGLEELRRVGVGGRDVRGEARALVEPVGLAELADDAAARGEVAEDAFARTSPIAWARAAPACQ